MESIHDRIVSQMPKWELWKSIYYAIDGSQDPHVETIFKETLNLLEAQATDPMDEDTPESLAQEIENGVNFNSLLQFAKNRHGKLTKITIQLEKEIERIIKAISDHS